MAKNLLDINMKIIWNNWIMIFITLSNHLWFSSWWLLLFLQDDCYFFLLLPLLTLFVGLDWLLLTLDADDADKSEAMLKDDRVALFKSSFTFSMDWITGSSSKISIPLNDVVNLEFPDIISRLCKPMQHFCISSRVIIPWISCFKCSSSNCFKYTWHNTELVKL